MSEVMIMVAMQRFWFLLVDVKPKNHAGMVYGLSVDKPVCILKLHTSWR
jgi:hypothetical protein